ncbi:MAG: hypothetical protein H6Q48_5279 [Deltaproteobacteria bacterium]|nr:hypothetical protein [Deltaproteobacteria bacterium]
MIRPMPEKTTKIVNTIPAGDMGPISLYPTVVMVITVMYRESRRLHFSMSMYPVVPSERTTSRIPKPFPILRMGKDEDVTSLCVIHGL